MTTLRPYRLACRHASVRLGLAGSAPVGLTAGGTWCGQGLLAGIMFEGRNPISSKDPSWKVLPT